MMAAEAAAPLEALEGIRALVTWEAESREETSDAALTADAMVANMEDVEVNAAEVTELSQVETAEGAREAGTMEVSLVEKDWEVTLVVKWEDLAPPEVGTEVEAVGAAVAAVTAVTEAGGMVAGLHQPDTKVAAEGAVEVEAVTVEENSATTEDMRGFAESEAGTEESLAEED